MNHAAGTTNHLQAAASRTGITVAAINVFSADSIDVSGDVPQ